MISQDKIFDRQNISDKHIVFDLDNTLIYTPEEGTDWYNKILESNKNQIPHSISSRVGRIVIPNGSKNPDSFKGVLGTVEMIFIIRPGCLELLSYCFSTFKTVSIWSAGSREYVRGIVDNLFRRLGRYPHIVWTYDELVKGIKPLSAMIKVFKSTGMNLRNVILVDDLEYNFGKNPGNGVLIPEYKPETTLEGIMKHDDILYRLRRWLSSNYFRSSTDVRQLDKKSVFT